MTLSDDDALEGQFDEYVSHDGGPQMPFDRSLLDEIAGDVLQQRQQAAIDHLRDLGITFNVYGHGDGVEKIWPIDILPRTLAADEWSLIEIRLAAADFCAEPVLR